MVYKQRLLVPPIFPVGKVYCFVIVVSISCNSIHAKITFYSGDRVLTSPFAIVGRACLPGLTSGLYGVTTRGGTRGVIINLPIGVSNSCNCHYSRYETLNRGVTRLYSLPVRCRSRQLAAIVTRKCLGSAGIHNGGEGRAISTISTIIVLRSCVSGGGGWVFTMVVCNNFIRVSVGSFGLGVGFSFVLVLYATLIFNTSGTL